MNQEYYSEIIPEDDTNSEILYNGINKLIIKKKIRKRRSFYNDLLEHILHECKDEKEKLDMYYNYLQRWHTAIQSSVIIVSTASTFLQTFTQSLFINNDSSDDYINDDYINDTLIEDEDENDFGYIPILTLCVSTYSGLILSLAKFFKLDERKENIHNLRERFAELHNKINHLIDLLKPWSKSEYFDDLTIDKINKWTNIVLTIEKEYLNIIDVKKNLFIEFEKVIDSIIRQDYNRQHIRFKKKQGELSNEMTKLNRIKELNLKESTHKHDEDIKDINNKYQVDENVSDEELNYENRFHNDFSTDKILSQIVEPNINKKKNINILDSLIVPDTKVDMDVLEKISQKSEEEEKDKKDNEEKDNEEQKEEEKDNEEDEEDKKDEEENILLENKKDINEEL